MKKVVWAGKVDRCDLCTTKIGSHFIDGRLRSGQWAILCPNCFTVEGVGLGLGKGQLYEKQGKDFVKIEG
ncbi:hypothetical protein KO465_04970 [Candidatus Micrarchaeota archaeon]|nr:hypothetical protein [Candidatus Micrarchaeota archaeon]